MANNSNLSYNMRVVHRYLGFFLAGIMAVYAISGILMVYRNTDFLKKEVIIEKQLSTGLSKSEIGPLVKSKLRFQKEEGGVIYYNKGTYDSQSGQVRIVEKKLPFILEKMEKMHKATTNSPLYFLNIFFGVSLLFFVLSAFWMFMPGSDIFKKGLYFTAGGVILTLIMIFV